MKGVHSSSSKLFAQPSFIEGMSRVLDIGATLQQYNESATERKADTKALKNDWLAVGDDFRHSIRHYEQASRRASAS